MLPLEMPTALTCPSTPTSVTNVYDAFATPSPKKRSHIDMSASPTCVEDASTWTRVARMRCDYEAPLQPMVEPLGEPAVDEIPIADLLFWLGDETTGQLACPCRSCRAPLHSAKRTHRRHRGHYLYIPQPVYSGLSAKIPVIALPRIEGIN